MTRVPLTVDEANAGQSMRLIAHGKPLEVEGDAVEQLTFDASPLVSLTSEIDWVYNGPAVPLAFSDSGVHSPHLVQSWLIPAGSAAPPAFSATLNVRLLDIYDPLSAYLITMCAFNGVIVGRAEIVVT